MQLLGNYWLFWFAVGFVFLFLEVMTPGVVFLFFGLGAWVVMALLFLIPIPVYVQWVLFLALSLAFLALLRGKVNALFRKGGSDRRGDSLKDPLVADQYIGREVVVVKAITPDKSGIIELNGSNWQARAHTELAEGANAKIVELKDLIVWVEPV
jgi:membrane protein implicated in regulation of membrane protease activity